MKAPNAAEKRSFDKSLQEVMNGDGDVMDMDITFDLIASVERMELFWVAAALGMSCHGNAPNRKIRERIAIEWLRRTCVLKGVID